MGRHLGLRTAVVENEQQLSHLISSILDFHGWTCSPSSGHTRLRDRREHIMENLGVHSEYVTVHVKGDTLGDDVDIAISGWIP